MRYSLLIKAPGLHEAAIVWLLKEWLTPNAKVHEVKTGLQGGVARVDVDLHGIDITAMYRWFAHWHPVGPPGSEPAPAGTLLLFTEVPSYDQEGPT